MNDSIETPVQSPEPRPWLRGLVYVMLLGLEFIVLYTACNVYTTTRTDTGYLFAEWELSIPLIPWMIIPYMAIDLMFVFAVFLPRTKSDLNRLALQLFLVPVVGCLFFLVFPLTLGFQRHPIDSVFRPVFDHFFLFDQPHNLLPSLHVTFGLVLRRLFSRHTTGVWRWLSNAWFLLIIASTLFTHQHHVADLVGGAVIGLVILYLVPDTGLASDEERDAGSPARKDVNLRGCLLCATGAGVFLLVGWLLRPWGFLLYWPVFALTVTAAGYGGLGARIYRKINGRIYFAARILLAPYLVGLQLYRRWMWKRAPASSEVGKALWLGRVPQPAALAVMREQGLSAIVDMTAEHDAPFAHGGVPYLNVQVLDMTAPTKEDIARAVEFLKTHEAEGKRSLVYCGLGYSRSAVVAAAYLAASGEAATPEDAIHRVEQSRPQVVFRERLRRLLKP